MEGRRDPPCIPVQWGAALPLEALETLQTNGGWVKRAAKKNQTLNLFDFCPEQCWCVFRGEQEGNAALKHVFLCCKGCRSSPWGLHSNVGK